MDGGPLPKAEDNQQRREHQRDQAIGYEYDPERNDQQSHQHYRGVDPHAVVDLLAAVAYEEGRKHRYQKQGELDQKPGRHREEMRR